MLAPKDDRKISLCIPTWNRVDMTIEAFMEVYADPRISEIVISDDASDLDLFHQLRAIAEKFDKVRLFRNLTNQDCYRNKMTAISLAKNEWCILLDSDNIIDRSYIDKLYDFSYWDTIVIFTPSYAKPMFDFREFAGLMIYEENVSDYLDRPMFETMLNAANFFVHKDTYLRAFDNEVNPVTSDSIFIAHNHLKDGGIIHCVDGLEYEHRVHTGSHYQNNVHRTPNGFHETILNKLRRIK